MSRAALSNHRLHEDWHVHSQWSDGKGSLEDNIQSAEAKGLTMLGCVDHVRRDTMWVQAFVRDVARVQETTHVQLIAGLECKLLNEGGCLDIPGDHALADMLYIADHQVPFEDGCITPRLARVLMQTGAVSRDRLVDGLVNALMSATQAHPRNLVAHLFSVLPKLGLDDGCFDDAALIHLGEHFVATETVVEIDERWRAPSIRVARLLRGCGVRLVMSSDAHMPKRIGEYHYCEELVHALR